MPPRCYNSLLCVGLLERVCGCHCCARLCAGVGLLLCVVCAPLNGVLQASKVAAKATKAKSQKFVVDLSAAVKDGIIKTGDFETFLNGAMKVDGKAGNLAGKVTITRDSNKVTITTSVPMAKRAIKYYTKKYLKKQQVCRKGLNAPLPLTLWWIVNRISFLESQPSSLVMSFHPAAARLPARDRQLQVRLRAALLQDGR